jgi:hypothetical protein
MALVWVYSSHALTKLSGLPDLLIRHIRDRGHVGAVEHLNEVVLLVFCRSEGTVSYSRLSANSQTRLRRPARENNIFFSAVSVTKKITY